MSSKRSRSLSPHRLSRSRNKHDEYINYNQSEADMIPLESRSMDLFKSRMKKLNKNQNITDIPLLEIQEDDDSDALAGGPLLPVFSQNSAISENSHTPLRDTSRERQSRIANEIENDFDEEFNSREGMTIPQENIKVQSIPSRLQESDLYFEESSEDESTDEEEEEEDNGSTMRDEPARRFYGQTLNEELDDENNSDSHLIMDTFSKLKKKFGSNPDLQEDGNLSDAVSTKSAKSLKSSKSSHANGGSLIRKVLQFGQSGIHPAMPKKSLDEEESIGDDIPMYDLRHFENEARGIVSRHARMNSLPSNPDFDFSDNGTTDFLVDSNNLPDYDETLESDLPKKVRAGVTSSLMALYNNNHDFGNSSTVSELDEIPFNNNSNRRNQINGNKELLPHFSRLNPKNSLSESQLELSTDSSKSSSADPFTERHKRTFSGQSIRNLISRSRERSSTPVQPTQRGRTKEAHTLRSIISGSRERTPSAHRGRSKERSQYSLPDFTKKDTGSSIISGKKKKKKITRVLQKKAKKHETAARITVHIADVLQRQRFILTLCKAFMFYGAPNHRLEEYLSMTARVLEIDSTFVYFPGIMIISFTDAVTRTSEMKLVRCSQGLDLGKLDSAHEVYKSVVHDRMGVEEASRKIEELLDGPSYLNKFWLIIAYGLSSCTVISWAFGGSWLDIPIAFILGSALGFMQFVIVPKSTIYSSVFEVSSSLWLSFFGRAIGSIGGGKYFCYGAIVQGGLCMILPGYIILSGALEIQSKSLVAGTVRMFYAIIYSLFLGFGLTLGAALYGWIDKDATSAASCSSNISPWFNLLMVPLFTIFCALSSQATFTQLPVMTFIGCGGYVVTYFAGKHFKVTEFSSALGSFAIGLLSNLYSRVGKNVTRFRCSMAFTAMLPGIFDQVPGGVASRSFLASGVNSADSIVNGSSSSTTSTTSLSSLTFGISMTEIAIGITVGLFVSTMVVYPFGKQKTGLFTL